MKQTRMVYLVMLFVFPMSACVQATKKQTVHFSVDSSQELNVNTISVRGSVPPLKWNKDFFLHDNDQDSIYTGTIVFDIPYDYVNIKFVKNEGEFELKDQPNRQLVFDKSLTTNYSATFNKTNDGN